MVRTSSSAAARGGIVILVLVTACMPPRPTTIPRRVTDVRDSSVVRFSPGPGQPFTYGQALDWAGATPRILTSRGDTLPVPLDARLEVRLPERRAHPVAGVVIGWAIGVVVSYASCPPPKRYCGEEDPTPLLGAAIGWLVGRRVLTDWWVVVRR